MNAQEKLYTYMDGWRDGAYGKPMNPEKQEIQIYEEGYTEGRLDRGAEMRRIAEQLGASINVLRAI